MANQDIREAAETLLGSYSYGQRNISHSQSVNLISDDLMLGYRNNRRMSTVRRFFCLFITFDVLFTSLIWLICVMIRGDTLEQIFDKEVIHYSIKESLFDIVMVAVCRFTILLLFYALLYINNWSVIALSTGGTCAFLIAKVFVYDWPNAAQPVYQVFLILTSFTIAWSEAWFLDFRVLPQELQAKNILTALVSQGNQSERTPLLLGGRPGVSHGAESTVNWFSPIETPEASPRLHRPGQEVILTQDLIDEYMRNARTCAEEAWRIISLPGWKMEKRGAVRGDCVEYVHTPDYGKVYRFTGMVDCPARFLFDEMSENITNLPKWNPTILKCDFIKKIAPGIDLSYQVTAGGGRGVIAARDFVTLRHNVRVRADGSLVPQEEQLGGDGEPYAYLSAGHSVEVPGYPPTANYVRGDNKVGCWCIRPTMTKTSSGKLEARCTFQWLMCCNLKGKIPQFVLDAAFGTVMLEYVEHVRKFAASAKAKGVF